MTYAKKAFFSGGLTALLACLVVTVAPEASAQKYADAASVGAVHTRVVELTNKLREARHVEDATRKYSAAYGTAVGRWVQLARDVGWRWGDIPKLMAVIYRESRGVPTATNASSGASGLLQFMPQWYNGLWSLPAFDPYNPRTNLRMGLKLYKMQGWQPWAY